MTKINEKEIKELFKNLKNNDRTAFELLYTRYNKLVYKIAYSILKNEEDSEDIVQNVFSKIYKIDKQKLPTDKESSWLYKVTKNETLTLLRKKNNNIELEETYEIEDKNNEIDNLINQDSYNKLISNLKEKEKEVVSLKIISNLSFSEIGKLLNEPTGTIKWRYYKSIHTLRLLLSNLGIFIITFIIGIKTFFSKRVHSNQEIGNQETNKENVLNIKENVLNIIVEDKEDYKDIITNKNLTEQITINEETISQNSQEHNTTQEQTLNNYNYYGIGILSISAIFLILTIISLNFHIKHQLKSKQKASK